jgi:heme/copper-type cytochrome/quinol oxidase subunit 3
MTWSALALGVAQVPFLVALVMAFRSPASARDDSGASFGEAGPSAPHSARGDSGASFGEPRPIAPDLAPWLLAAWMAMFFGSLLSGYVLLRAGNAEWPHQASGWDLAIGGTVLLALAALLARPTRMGLLASAVPGAAVVVWLSSLHGAAFNAGHTPASHLEFASWFTLTGVLLTIVAIVCVAAAWSALGRSAASAARARGLRVTWGVLSLIWLVLLSAFSVA